MSSRVGVRELRQNLSVYLRRVKAGETLEVTERGRPVAMLGPPTAESDPYERLIAEGKVIAGDGGWEELGPPPAPPPGVRPMSQILQDLRDEESF